jgi:hypothetical protein
MARHLRIAAAAAHFDPPEPLRRHLRSTPRLSNTSVGAFPSELQPTYWQLAAL